MPAVVSEVSRGEVREEGNLLIEAVSLLVQRQRETESWVTEQLGQAEERATATERLTADFEARLATIEAHLARLVSDVAPLPGDAGIDEQLERLREQMEGLKSSAPGSAAPPGPVGAGSPGSAAPARPHGGLTAGAGDSFRGWPGPRTEQRFGFVLMAAGTLAVLYGTVAFLSQLRFG